MASFLREFFFCFAYFLSLLSSCLVRIWRRQTKTKKTPFSWFGWAKEPWRQLRKVFLSHSTNGIHKKSNQQISFPFLPLSTWHIHSTTKARELNYFSLILSLFFSLHDDKVSLSLSYFSPISRNNENIF